VNGIVDRVYLLTVSLAAGAVAAFLFTLGFRHGSSSFPWGLLLPFSLHGALIAIPLALFGGGIVHDPNITVIRVVDFLFYSFLAYKVLEEFERQRAK